MKTVGGFIWNMMFILIEHNWHAPCEIKENSMTIVHRMFSLTRPDPEL